MKIDKIIESFQDGFEKLHQEFQVLFNTKISFVGQVPNIDDDFDSIFTSIYYNLETLASVRQNYSENYNNFQNKVNERIEEYVNKLPKKHSEQDKNDLRKYLQEEAQKIIQPHRNISIIKLAQTEGTFVYTAAAALVRFNKEYPNIEKRIRFLKSKARQINFEYNLSPEAILLKIKPCQEELQQLTQEMAALTTDLNIWGASQENKESTTCSDLKKKFNASYDTFNKIQQEIQEDLEKICNKQIAELAILNFRKNNQAIYKDSWNTLKSLEEPIRKLSIDSTDESFNDIYNTIQAVKNSLQDVQNKEFNQESVPNEEVKSFFDVHFILIEQLEGKLDATKASIEQQKITQEKEKEETRIKQEALKIKQAELQKIMDEKKKEKDERVKQRIEKERVKEENDHPELVKLKYFLYDRISYIENLINPTEKDDLQESNSDEKKTKYYNASNAEIKHYKKQLSALNNIVQTLFSDSFESLPQRLMRADSFMNANKKTFSVTPEGQNIFETIINFISGLIKKIQKGVLFYEGSFWPRLNTLRDAAQAELNTQPKIL